MATFANQEKLPSLPVPPLEQTLRKYLDSVKPHLSPKELQHTERLISDFKVKEGPKLHKLLLEKASKERNWLEKWWELVAYLTPRYSIYPLVCFGGLSPHPVEVPPTNGTQLPRTAAYLYYMLDYWQKLREETIPQQTTRGKALCMNQFHRLFSTCRIPRPNVDELVFHFKTLKEEAQTGQRAPTHIIVMYRGRFWRMEVLNSKGQLHTIEEYYAALREIHEYAHRFTWGPALSTLTAHNRDRWAELRQHLISLAPDNARHMDAIEKAIVVISLTDESPETNDELAIFAVAGDPRYQWADKNWVRHQHANGLGTSTSDHSPFDAVVSMSCMHNVDECVLKDIANGKGPDTYLPTRLPSVQVPKWEYMDFVIDKKITTGINEAYTLWQTTTDDLQITTLHFTGFGTEYFKAKKIYGDTLVQLALQLGYIRQHNKPAPTYETATTRQFYHGRTETVRSCTPEAVEWARLMLQGGKGKPSKQQLLAKFMHAHEAHNRLMEEGQANQGCDRHLLGLRLLAREHGMPDPEIYSDPAWVKSGGDGNYILSTSFVGYSNVFGGVTPMCANGYGTFYKMQEKSISVFMCAWKSNPETNLAQWKDTIHWALWEIHGLLEGGSSKL